MKAQWILYNQINTCYGYDDVDQYIFLHSKKNPISPYGPLILNKHSQNLAYDTSTIFMSELQNQGKHATREAVDSYYLGIKNYCQQYAIDTLVVMEPSEPMLLKQILAIQKKCTILHLTIEIRPNTQFFITQEVFATQFAKPPVMEVFYRWMRKKFTILMDGDVPLGGKWNFDADNRTFDRGYIPNNTSLVFPTSRAQAQGALRTFIDTTLHRFGELEDAMYVGDDVVHHSLLSTSINFGLLTPQEVVDAIQKADTAINNKEGCIRQILGWREYMYHRFWHYKDSIYDTNALNHTKKLPDWFRRPDRSPLMMHCVNHVLHGVKNTGYSHHITRLMIIGNFTLLMGYNPHDVNKWFWEMYADAFERVVTPNVLGMSQFADGGNLATKPYVSSANYINKMSDYCRTCYYDPKIKEGEKACPMNYLYWNFIDKHRDLFKRQPYIVANLDKISLEEVRKQSQDFMDTFS